MNAEDLLNISSVKRIKIRNIVGKKILALSGIKKKLLIGKAG